MGQVKRSVASISESASAELALRESHGKQPKDSAASSSTEAGAKAASVAPAPRTPASPHEPAPGSVVGGKLWEAQSFLGLVKKLAEERGIVSVVVGCVFDGERGPTVLADAFGRDGLHAELAAQAYATHTLPIMQRAERLSRIASTPSVAAPEPKGAS